MEKNANLDSAKIAEHKNCFNKAIDNCVEVFGENVFTNPAAERQRKGLVHYDLLMSTVGKLDSELAKSRAAEIQAAYKELCESEAFKKTLSGGLQNKSSIIRRRSGWDELLEKAIHAS